MIKRPVTMMLAAHMFSQQRENFALIRATVGGTIKAPIAPRLGAIGPSDSYQRRWRNQRRLPAASRHAIDYNPAVKFRQTFRNTRVTGVFVSHQLVLRRYPTRSRPASAQDKVGHQPSAASTGFAHYRTQKAAGARFQFEDCRATAPRQPVDYRAWLSS